MRLCMGEVEEGGAGGMRPPYIGATRERKLSSDNLLDVSRFILTYL